jgi:hypothetical protein
MPRHPTFFFGIFTLPEKRGCSLRAVEETRRTAKKIYFLSTSNQTKIFRVYHTLTWTRRGSSKIIANPDGNKHMTERQLHCEPAKEAAADKNPPDIERTARMPKQCQPEGNDPNNDEIKRDRYRMR